VKGRLDWPAASRRTADSPHVDISRGVMRGVSLRSTHSTGYTLVMPAKAGIQYAAASRFYSLTEVKY
jgi:hypothetical protein